MCGINAILDLGGKFDKELHLATLRRMNARIQHRGPDANCMKSVHPNIHFGHLRLSIIDLTERGNQPMFKSGCTVTYNGEIYNYLEIRKELEQLGCKFQTSSDTEVLIEAYLQWGEKALLKFNGMWAFILYDANKDSVFVSRDRFGKKPLYYTCKDGVYYFSSELKAFSEVRKFELNSMVAAEFLHMGWQEHSNHTMVDNIFHFPKGSFAQINVLSPGKFEPVRFYQISHTPALTASDITFNEAKSHLRDLIFDSVELRLRSDVDVAFALSGGIDSSIIAGVAAEIKGKNSHHNTQLRTFSSVFTSSEMNDYNEKKFIDAVLKKRPEFKPSFITPDVDGFISEMDELLYVQDEPFYSAGMFAQRAVYRLIHSHGVKVSMDGQGADEAIGGYSSYNSIYLHELNQKKDHRFYKELAGFAVYYPDLFLQLIKLRFSRGRVFKTERLAKKFSQIHNSEIDPAVYGFRENCIFQIDHLYLPSLLHHQDRNSMAYGIESRSPFMDYRVMEFLLSLPVEYKLNFGRRKYILREAFRDLLPEEVYKRYNKLGFPAPLALWMKSNHNTFSELLKDARQSGIAADGIETLFDQQRKIGYRDYLSFIRIIYLDRWIKKFNVSY